MPVVVMSAEDGPIGERAEVLVIDGGVRKRHEIEVLLSLAAYASLAARAATLAGVTSSWALSALRGG